MARANRAKGFHFRTLLLKYFRILMLSLGAPLTILTGVIIVLLVSNERSSYRLQGEKLLSNASNYVDGVWEHTQWTGTQAAYEPNITDFFRLNRSSLSLQMLTGLGEVQSYLRAMSSGSSAVSSVIVNAFSPAYYVKSNSAWSSRPDHINSIPNIRYPYGLLKSFGEDDADAAWQLDGTDLCYLRAIYVKGQRVGCVFQRCDGVTLSENIKARLQDPTHQVYMVDDGGLVLLDSAMRATGRPLADVYPSMPAQYQGMFKTDGVSRSAASVASGVQRWRYVLVSDMTALNRYQTYAIVGGLATILIILALCTWIAYRLAAIICQPYETILDLLRTPVQDAKENYEHRYAAYDELGMVYTLINQTMYQNLTMRSELTERERALKDAQHIALQAQMNPHFMFNALEVINWRVFEKLPHDREITGMIQDLSLLLRLSLENDDPLISVGAEIHHAKVYLKIQQHRLNSPFSVEWDIAPELLDMTMLRLSLQPLFENAISHGIKKLDGDGAIKVEGRIEAGRMILSVVDNGPGFDEVALNRIRRNLIDSRWKRSASIGLVNVNTRIQLLFGVEYGVQIESAPFARTEVRITMPVEGARTRRNEP